MYVSAMQQPEPVYIAILDGRVQPTLMLDKQPVATTLASQASCRDDYCSDASRGCLIRGTSASSRCSASTSTTCSGHNVDESEEYSVGQDWPRLVWCEGSPEKRADQMEALAVDHLLPRHFASPSSFTRWYFDQSRPGQVAKLGTVLVVGWREAKPCAAAIRAAMTGNMEGLRSDCKRPQVSLKTKSLVRVMIVLAENQKQAKKAREWIKSESLLGKTIEFRVVLNTDLGSELRALYLQGFKST